MVAKLSNKYLEALFSSGARPSLLGVPAEVRLLIYKALFHDSRITIKGDDRQRKVEHEYPSVLLLTCRQIRQEALPIDISSTSLIIDARKPRGHDYNSRSTYSISGVVPEKYISGIKHFSLILKHWTGETFNLSHLNGLTSLETIRLDVGLAFETWDERPESRLRHLLTCKKLATRIFEKLKWSYDGHKEQACLEFHRNRLYLPDGKSLEVLFCGQIVVSDEIEVTNRAGQSLVNHPWLKFGHSR